MEPRWFWANSDNHFVFQDIVTYRILSENQQRNNLNSVGPSSYFQINTDTGYISLVRSLKGAGITGFEVRTFFSFLFSLAHWKEQPNSFVSASTVLAGIVSAGYLKPTPTLEFVPQWPSGEQETCRDHTPLFLVRSYQQQKDLHCSENLHCSGCRSVWNSVSILRLEWDCKHDLQTILMWQCVQLSRSSLEIHFACWKDI